MLDLLILFVKGLLVGVAIAAPVGAVTVLCIRRTVMGNYALGLITGLGSCLADVLGATIAAFGLASISDLMLEYEFWLMLIGGFLLIYVGLRIIRSGPVITSQGKTTQTSPVEGIVQAFFLTITNPATVLGFVAVFAAMGIDHLDDSIFQPITLVLGVATGACGWWFSLSTSVYVMRHKLSEKQLIWINCGSGAMLIAFAIAIFGSLILH